jgi:hypothetical protein
MVAIQDILKKNPGWYLIPNGTIRSAGNTEGRFPHNDWLILQAASSRGVTVKLYDHILKATGATKVAFLDFKFLGSPLFQGIDEALFINCELSFPLADFDGVLKDSERAAYNGRCRTGPYLQESKNVAMINCDLHHAGSGITVSGAENFSLLGSKVWALGPSRDPQWHTDTLGLVDGGTTNLVVDGCDIDFPRFVFEDAGNKDGKPKSGRPHKNFKFTNSWMHDFQSVAFQFNIRGNPPANITGHMENITMWNLNGRPYRMEDTPNITRKFINRPGEKINYDPKWINVTEKNNQIVNSKPIGPNPMDVYRKHSSRDLMNWLLSLS